MGLFVVWGVWGFLGIFGGLLIEGLLGKDLSSKALSVVMFTVVSKHFVNSFLQFFSLLEYNFLTSYLP